MEKMLSVSIIHQDDAILVVDKPAGIAVISDGWHADAPYLLKILSADYGKLWVVHRLDKTTSGVLVFARTAEAHRLLSIEFELHGVQKVYHAILVGEINWSVHTARHSLRVNAGHRHRTVVDDRKGKSSETRFRVLNKYMGYSLVEAVPRTGRTHQIRVHAAALGYPVLGDLLYSSPKTELIARPALHALSLDITHPTAGEILSFSAPYPEDFIAAQSQLKRQKP